ncbi:hypothetical protein BN1708_018905, partial [Verticillium longisporum]
GEHPGPPQWPLRKEAGRGLLPVTTPQAVNTNTNRQQERHRLHSRRVRSRDRQHL